MERIGLDRLIANPLVLLMSHVLWTSFSRAFHLISFILLVSSKALGLCCTDFFAE